MGIWKSKKRANSCGWFGKSYLLFFQKKNYKTRLINIGTGEDLKISQYANLIKKEIEYKGKIIWDKTFPDGMKRKLLDISKMNKMGFQTQIEFKNGLKKVIKKFIENS